jgi:hypothetical protein
VSARAHGFSDLEARRISAVSTLLWGYPTDGIRLPEGRAHETLHPAVRDDALRAFEVRRIKWWRHGDDAGEAPGPTRLLRSSQVACVNHLEPARTRRPLALAVARSVVPDAEDVLDLDDGFLAFEWIGEQDLIGETGPRRRGDRVTSIDALMVARRSGGRRVGIIFEWKYTERYGAELLAVSSEGTSRVERYRRLLEDCECPIATDRLGDLSDLFYDPFLQLLRQTLLAWRLRADDDLYDEWMHIHVIPFGNRPLLDTVTAPKLSGRSMSEAWRSVLRRPSRYRHLTPSHLLAHVDPGDGPEGWRPYLGVRYAT